MLNLEPETVQLLAFFAFVIVLVCGIAWRRSRHLHQLPIITDRGFICVDQHRDERREKLRLIQARTNVVSFKQPAAKKGAWAARRHGDAA